MSGSSGKSDSKMRLKNIYREGLIFAMKILKYDSAEKIAHSFADYLNTENRTLSAQTHNRFELRKTHWWVVPGTDWPVHHFGKYIFKDEGDVIKGGVTVEKGLESEAAEVSPVRILMDDSWRWFSFFEDLESSIAGERISSVKEHVDSLLIEVGIEEVSDPPNYDPHHFKDEKFIYSYKDGSLDLKEEESRFDEFVMFKDLKSLSQLAATIAGLENRGWCWIDIDIVVPFYKKGTPEEPEDLVHEFSLGQLLRPIARWIA